MYLAIFFIGSGGLIGYWVGSVVRPIEQMARLVID